MWCHSIVNDQSTCNSFWHHLLVSFDNATGRSCLPSLGAVLYWSRLCCTSTSYLCMPCHVSSCAFSKVLVWSEVAIVKASVGILAMILVLLMISLILPPMHADDVHICCSCFFLFQCCCFMLFFNKEMTINLNKIYKIILCEESYVPLGD